MGAPTIALHAVFRRREGQVRKTELDAFIYATVEKLCKSKLADRTEFPADLSGHASLDRTRPAR
jgi:hypothetical protein